MNLFDDLLLLLFITLLFVFEHKEVVEVLGRFEKVRHQEIQKGPQFF